MMRGFFIYKIMLVHVEILKSTVRVQVHFDKESNERHP